MSLSDVVYKIASASERSSADLAQVGKPELVVLDASLRCQHRAAFPVANLANQLVGMIRFHMLLFLEDLVEDHLTEHTTIVFDPCLSSVCL